ncbi:nicotinate-nucleotide adenylyltransferase [Micromonospora sp. NPDC003197]
MVDHRQPYAGRPREGFAHGRFQILHLDHLAYLLAAANKCDFLRVGVTQPDPHRLRSTHQGAAHRHQPQANPLTYLERATMIRRTLFAAGLDQDRFTVQPFPIEQPELLTRSIPPTVVAYVTICDEWNVRKVELLRSLGYDVRVLFHRTADRITGSAIREMIRQRRTDWPDLVPPACRDYLLELDIEHRLRHLADEDQR